MATCLVLYPARSAGQGIILLQFLLLLLSSSSICQHVNISETLCTIVLILGHNTSLQRRTFDMTSLGSKVTKGSQGSKVHFHQKCYFSFRLNGMALGLLHIHQFDTLYKSYGSRNSAGVIWGHRGQKVIFTKMLFFLQIKWYGHGIHVCSSARYPLQTLWV